MLCPEVEGVVMSECLENGEQIEESRGVVDVLFEPCDENGGVDVGVLPEPSCPCVLELGIACFSGQGGEAWPGRGGREGSEGVL